MLEEQSDLDKSKYSDLVHSKSWQKFPRSVEASPSRDSEEPVHPDDREPVSAASSSVSFLKSRTPSPFRAIIKGLVKGKKII